MSPLLLKSALLAISSVLIAACCSGSDNSTTTKTDTIAPTISSSNPVDGTAFNGQ